MIDVCRVIGLYGAMVGLGVLGLALYVVFGVGMGKVMKRVSGDYEKGE